MNSSEWKIQVHWKGAWKHNIFIWTLPNAIVQGGRANIHAVTIKAVFLKVF